MTSYSVVPSYQLLIETALHHAVGCTYSHKKSGHKLYISQYSVHMCGIPLINMVSYVIKIKWEVVTTLKLFV
jgi:hypothetical protein